MLAQNAEPTGTTADLAALGEEDEDMSEMSQSNLRRNNMKIAKKEEIKVSRKIGFQTEE